MIEFDGDELKVVVPGHDFRLVIVEEAVSQVEFGDKRKID